MMYLARGRVSAVEKWLGKRRTIADRHFVASRDLIAKLGKIRIAAQTWGAAWNAAAARFQLIARDILAYAPLVGIPPAPSLHSEDAAFHRFVLTALGTRVMAEHVSLLVCRRAGGLQLPSFVESMVACVAQDCFPLLNGQTTAFLARDTLQEAMPFDPDEVDGYSGVVPHAVRFLAGYVMACRSQYQRTASSLA